MKLSIIKQWAITLSVFAAIGVIGEIAFLRLMPSSYWFVMQEIEPAQQEFMLGEKPKFKTTAVYKRGGIVKRTDIQYCSYTGYDDFIYYTIYESQSYNNAKIVVESLWNYDKHGPSIEADCYLFNVTTMELPYGLEKSQTVISSVYSYVE